MKAIMKAPVNLMDTLSADPGDSDGPSEVYIRHVVKSALRHAVDGKDLRGAEAENLWLELGFPLRKW